MAKWLGIIAFFIVIVIMYLLLGTETCRIGEKEEKPIEQEVQQENALIKKIPDSE